MDQTAVIVRMFAAPAALALKRSDRRDSSAFSANQCQRALIRLTERRRRHQAALVYKRAFQNLVCTLSSSVLVTRLGPIDPDVGAFPVTRQSAQSASSIPPANAGPSIPAMRAWRVPGARDPSVRAELAHRPLENPATLASTCCRVSPPALDPHRRRRYHRRPRTPPAVSSLSKARNAS